MDISSPSKQHRLERHIQRQRGAGARNLATSFGFSLGLPLVAGNSAASEAPEAPPVKRRKIDETSQTAAAESNPLSTDRIGSTLPKVGRQEPRNTKPTRLGRAAQSTPERAVEVDPSSRDTGTDIKTPHVVASTITTPKDDGPGVQQSVDDFVKPPARKRGRPKKNIAVAGSKNEEVIEKVTTTTTSRKRGRPKKNTEKVEAVTASKNEEVVENVPTTTTSKKRGRPKKGECDGTERASVHKDTPILDNEEPRPRRRAAATAMAKVLEGLIEEDIPIDKKRRDDVPPALVRKKRKRVEVLGTEEPSTMQNSDANEAPAKTTTPTATRECTPSKVRATGNGGGGKKLRAQRIPLAQAEANVTLRCVSPQKPSAKVVEPDRCNESARPVALHGECQAIKDQGNQKPARRKKTVKETQLPQPAEVSPPRGRPDPPQADLPAIVSADVRPSISIKTTKKTKNIPEPGKVAREGCQATLGSDNSVQSPKEASQSQGQPGKLRVRVAESHRSERKKRGMKNEVEGTSENPTGLQRPASTAVRTVRSSTRRSAKPYAPDIDLDDLLSNIAMFAAGGR